MISLNVDRDNYADIRPSSLLPTKVARCGPGGASAFIFSLITTLLSVVVVGASGFGLNAAVASGGVIVTGPVKPVARFIRIGILTLVPRSALTEDLLTLRANSAEYCV